MSRCEHGVREREDCRQCNPLDPWEPDFARAAELAEDFRRLANDYSAGRTPSVGELASICAELADLLADPRIER